MATTLAASAVRKITGVSLRCSLLLRISRLLSLDCLSGVQSSAPYFGWRRKTWRFAQGAAAGNLSEVGVGWATSGSLFSRALILDSGGTPTTITVLADEFLDVTYELRQYPVTTDNTGTFVLDGLTYDWVSRPANVTSSFVPNAAMNSASINYYNGAIGAITGSPSGTGSGLLTPTPQSYSTGSYSITFTLIASITQANLAGGITAARIIGSGFDYQFGFTPAIPKDNTKILSIDYTHSWARKTI